MVSLAFGLLKPQRGSADLKFLTPGLLEYDRRRSCRGTCGLTHHGRKIVEVGRRKRGPPLSHSALQGNPQWTVPRDGYPNMVRLASEGDLNLFLLNDHYRRRVYRTISLPLYSDCREGKGSSFVPADEHAQVPRGGNRCGTAEVIITEVNIY